MEHCSRCERVSSNKRPLVHNSGLCNSCYVRQAARVDVCVQCQQHGQIQSRGWCRKCYLARPDVRAKKNAARRKKSADGPSAVADYKRQQAYGVTPERFDAMRAAQGDQCAVCREPLDTSKRTGCQVDHDHTTGVVRGLLCGACNCGLGYFKDSPGRLLSAVGYLQKHGR